MNKNIPVLLTFPRSGVNYFVNYFYQSSSKLISSFHEYHQFESFVNAKNKNNKDYDLCTIIRNPLDTIVSSSLLAENFKKDLKKEILIDIVNETAERYNLFYKNNIVKMKYIINYDDFIENPKLTIKTFGNFFGIKTKEVEYVDNLFDSPKAGYLVSSKNTKHYNEVLNISKNTNLKECTYLYNLALNNKVLIKSDFINE
jgi:hypothetical protein